MRSSAVEGPPRLYGLAPLIDGRSRVVILGSFPSVKSLDKQEYYGNPQNHFWPIVERLLGIVRTCPYAERKMAAYPEGTSDAEPGGT